MRWPFTFGWSAFAGRRFAGGESITYFARAGSYLPAQAQRKELRAEVSSTAATARTIEHTLMKSYLVTGGCGFIGVNLVARLAGHGCRIRVLDDLSMGNRDDIRPFDVDLYVGDIRDAAALAEVCRGRGIAYV